MRESVTVRESKGERERGREKVSEIPVGLRRFRSRCLGMRSVAVELADLGKLAAGGAGRSRPFHCCDRVGCWRICFNSLSLSLSLLRMVIRKSVSGQRDLGWFVAVISFLGFWGCYWAFFLCYLDFLGVIWAFCVIWLFVICGDFYNFGLFGLFIVILIDLYILWCFGLNFLL